MSADPKKLGAPVPQHILDAITAYGDQRADGGLGSAVKLAEVILAMRRHYRAPSHAASTAPVAYLHQVVSGDGEPDEALSFAPDNFPLYGTLGYWSVSHEPLFTATQAAQLTEDELMALVPEVKIKELWAMCAYWGAVDVRVVPFARAIVRAAILANQSQKG